MGSGRSAGGALGVILACCGSTAGADWTVTPSLEIGAVYSDNYDQVLEDPRDEKVVRVVPGVVALREGEALDLSLDLSARYQREIDRETSEFLPSASVEALQSLLPNRLWLGVQGQVSQRRSDSVPLLVDRSTDDEETYEARIGPLYERRFGNGAEVSASYSYGVSRTDAEIDSGSDSHAADGEIRYQLGRSDLLGSLRASHDFARFEDDEEASATTVLTALAYPATSTLITRAIVGVDYIDLPDIDRSRSPAWGVGLDWRPLSTVEARLQYLERDFGEQPSIELLWSGRRSAITLSWQRDLSIQREFGLESGALQEGFVNAEIDAVEDDLSSSPSTEASVSAPDFDEGLSPLRGNASTVTETVGIEWSLRGRVAQLAVGANWSERTSLEPDSDGTTTGESVLARFSRPLSRLLVFELGLSHLREKDSGEAERMIENRADVAVGFVF